MIRQSLVPQPCQRTSRIPGGRTCLFPIHGQQNSRWADRELPGGVRGVREESVGKHDCHPLEQILEGHGLVAAGAQPAGPEPPAEPVAVLAALDAEVASAAVGAGVDSAVLGGTLQAGSGGVPRLARKARWRQAFEQ
jgi:hypothetical protein